MKARYQFRIYPTPGQRQSLARLFGCCRVYPLSGLFAATKAMQSCLHHLKECGTTTGFEDLVSFQEFEQLIEVPHYQQLEQRFSS